MAAETSRPAQPDRPPPTFGESVASGCGQIALGIMFLGAFLCVYNGVFDHLIPAYRIRNVYVPADAAVLATTIDTNRDVEGRQFYYPKVRLRYDANGQAREEWTHLDRDEPSDSRERAEADLRGYPVGRQLTVWYDPARPERVVLSRDAWVRYGWWLVATGLGGLAFTIGIPLGPLVRRARRELFVFRQTTGRVVGSEIRMVSADGSPRAFQPVLVVEYDSETGVSRGMVRGECRADHDDAEEELREWQSAHPVGEAQPFWYDPRERENPTFTPPLTLAAFLWQGTLIVLSPVLNVVSGGFRYGQYVWEKVTTPSPTSVSTSHRVMMIVAALLVIGLTVRFVFWQDYKCYFVFPSVPGKVISADAAPDPNGGFEPRVRFSYVIDGHYYERSTHKGWHSAQLSQLTQAEAEAMVAPYPVGSEVQVWYNPSMPLQAIIKQYTRWYLYPLILPPLWLLVVQTRRLLRRG